MNKVDLRAKYQEKRAALTASEKSKLEDLMLIQFQQLDIEIPSIIMTYAAFERKNEFDPQLITDYCFFKNPDHVLLYPSINCKTDKLQAIEVNDDSLFELNKFGIPEPAEGYAIVPEEIDLIIVPLLAYDVKGNRVGYGKGYYDRFLKECKDDALKIGFSFFEPEPIIEGINRMDIKLDYCISPERIYSF